MTIAPTRVSRSRPRIRRASRAPLRRTYLWQFIRGLLLVQFLLFATWNNSGYSYFGWVTGAHRFTALMAVAGIALLVAHVVVIRIAFVALNYAGIIAASLLLTVLLLTCSQLDLIELEPLTRQVEFWLCIAAAIVSIGIAWAKYQQRISGQINVLKSPP